METPRSERAPLGPPLLAAARHQLRTAHSFLSSKGEAQHDGIHEARKCIRRARATLALGAHVFGSRAKRLDDELGRLCRSMSGLRDAEALVEELRRLEGSAPTTVHAILPSARMAAQQRRDQLLEHFLTRDPGFASRRRRLLAAEARLARLDWQAVGDIDVAEAVKRSERRAGKARRQAHRHADDESAWHVYRRRLRRLRQQDTLLGELRPELRPSLDGLDDHTKLGESQDDALLLKRCGRGSPFPPEQRALLRELARQRLQHARRH
jgi:CHAD domain-containing protein